MSLPNTLIRSCVVAEKSTLLPAGVPSLGAFSTSNLIASVRTVSYFSVLVLKKLNSTGGMVNGPPKRGMMVYSMTRLPEIPFCVSEEWMSVLGS